MHSSTFVGCCEECSVLGVLSPSCRHGRKSVRTALEQCEHCRRLSLTWADGILIMQSSVRHSGLRLHLIRG